jgi:hypothetical protein
VTKAASRRLLTPETRVHAWVNQYEICGEQSSSGRSFSPSSSIIPCQYHSTMALYTHISSDGWTIGPLVTTVQRHSLTPSTWTKLSLPEALILICVSYSTDTTWVAHNLVTLSQVTYFLHTSVHRMYGEHNWLLAGDMAYAQSLQQQPRFLILAAHPKNISLYTFARVILAVQDSGKQVNALRQPKVKS